MGLFTRKAAWGLTIALLLVLLISSAVFAEGDMPEGEEPSAQVEAATEEEDSAAVALDPSSEVQPSDGGNAPNTNEGDSLEVEAPVEETESAAASEENTAAAEDIVLVDEAGEALDMASQASAEAIAGGDPWWISGGVKYAV